MWKFIHQLQDMLSYDADRDFYAKVFPDSVQTKDLLRIRKMRHDDLPSIMRIEERNYEFPWPESIFKDCFRVMTYHNWVLEAPSRQVVGYCIVSIAAGEAHIMNISICPSHQNQGGGRKLLEHMVAYARPRAEKIYLEVRPSNLGAIALYRKIGFQEIGVRKGYYPAKTGREDAVMYELDLAPML